MIIKEKYFKKIYEQVSDHIRKQIQNGKIASNERILPERRLAEEHGVSLMTMRKSLKVLVDEGILVRRRGKGTFVKQFYLQTGNPQIGLLLPRINDTYTALLIKEMQNQASARGYGLMIGNSRQEMKKGSLRNAFDLRYVRGVLVRPDAEEVQNSKYTGYLERLLQKKVPIVSMNIPFTQMPITHIGFDEKAGTFEACRLLLDAGRKRIAYLGNLENYLGKLRWEGFQNALEQNGRQVDNSLIFDISKNGFFSDPAGQIKKIMGKKPDALIVAFPPILHASLAEISALEIKIPKSLVVAAVVEEDYMKTVNDEIIGIVKPISELSKKCVQCLIRMITKSFQAKQRNLLIPYCFSIPESLRIRINSRKLSALFTPKPDEENMALLDS